MGDTEHELQRYYLCRRLIKSGYMMEKLEECRDAQQSENPCLINCIKMIFNCIKMFV